MWSQPLIFNDTNMLCAACLLEFFGFLRSQELTAVWSQFVDYRFVEFKFIDYFCTSIVYSGLQRSCTQVNKVRLLHQYLHHVLYSKSRLYSTSVSAGTKLRLYWYIANGPTQYYSWTRETRTYRDCTASFGSDTRYLWYSIYLIEYFNPRLSPSKLLARLTSAK